MKISTKCVIVFFVTIATFFLLSPFAIYYYGLSQVEGKPSPPQKNLSKKQVQKIWEHFGGKGKAEIQPMTPYKYFAYMHCKIYATEHGRISPEKINKCENKYKGTKHSSFAVRKFVFENIKDKNNLKWHISNIAFTIWVTNNWETADILASSEEIMNRDKKQSETKKHLAPTAKDDSF